MNDTMWRTVHLITRGLDFSTIADQHDIRLTAERHQHILP